MEDFLAEQAVIPSHRRNQSDNLAMYKNFSDLCASELFQNSSVLNG